MTFLSNRILDYTYVSQGFTRIHGVNDGEEFQITDVSDRIGAFTLNLIFMISFKHIVQLGIFYEHNTEPIKCDLGFQGRIKLY